MHDAGIHARPAQRRNGLNEALRLNLEVERFRRVGRGEVGERAHEVERTMEAHLPHEFHHFVVPHANAVHTRVHSQVVRRTHAERVGSLGVLDGELGGVHAWHDLVGQKQRDSRFRRLRQDKNRGVHQRFAQLDSLVHRGHAQVVGTGIERGLSTAHRAVAVGVGLHHSHEAHAVVDTLLHGARVVTNGVEVDFRPCPATIDIGNEP